MSNVPDQQTLARLLPEINAIAKRAGDAILEIYQQDFDVEHKADDSPLTAADLASHRVITEALSNLDQDWPLLSEESRGIDWATRRGWQTYWLIDPLDGTKEFVNRNGEFTVNIALIHGGTPMLGVVYVPVSGVSYSGIVGQGAWRQEGDNDPNPISVTLPAQSPPRVIGSRSHMSDRVRLYMEGLGESELVSMGSSLKFCLVAEGRADLYPRLGPTSEWDTAAAQAVVEGAGGLVTRTDGTPLRYNTRETLLNPEFLVFGDKGVNWTVHVPDGLTHEDTLK